MSPHRSLLVAHGRTLGARGRAAVIVVAYLVVAFLVQILPSASREASASAGPDVADGARVWLAGNCVSCHALFGLGGHVGPDLTNVVQSRGIPLVQATVRAGRPGMPAYAFTDAELEQLAAYLAQVGATGTYPAQRRPLARWGEEAR